MNRLDIYKKLFKLKSEGNIEVSKLLDKYALSEITLEDLSKYLDSFNFNDSNLFLEILKSKPLYKSLYKAESNIDKAKCLSSLITHSLIEISKNPENTNNIISFVNLIDIIDSLKEYLIENNNNKMDLTLNQIKNLFNKVGA